MNGLEVIVDTASRKILMNFMYLPSNTDINQNYIF